MVVKLRKWKYLSGFDRREKDFHSCNMGSIPIGTTIKIKDLQSITSLFFVPVAIYCHFFLATSENHTATLQHLPTID